MSLETIFGEITEQRIEILRNVFVSLFFILVDYILQKN